MKTIKVKRPDGTISDCPEADREFFEQKEGYEVISKVKKSSKNSK